MNLITVDARWIWLFALLQHCRRTETVFVNLPHVTSTIDDCLTSETDFAKVVFEDTYIDNTVFIKDYLEVCGKMRIYIAYPRGFGKSTMMDMLRKFLEAEVDTTTATVRSPIHTQSYKLFTDRRLHLNITNNTCWVLDPGDIHLIDPGRHPLCIDEFLARYPVIFLSFRYVNGDTPEVMIQQITQTVQRLYKKYSWLHDIRRNASWHLDDDFSRYFNRSRFDFFGRVLHGKADKADMGESLVFLSQLLCMFFGKRTFIFIDDYDYPFLHSLQKGKVYREVYEFMDSMFLPLFEMPLPKHRVRSVYTTLIMASSTLSRATKSLKSDMRFLSRRCIGENSLYTENIGFFDGDVDDLFARYNIGYDERLQVGRYYNGYLYWDFLWCMYFPADIVNYVKHRQLRDYRETSNVTYRFLQNMGMKKIRQKALLLLFRKDPDVKLTMDITYEQLEDFFRPVSQKNLLDEVNNRNRIHNLEIVNIFFTYLFENGFIRCYPDRYVNEPPPDNCKIPNTRMYAEFRRNIQTHYNTYGLNFTDHPVALHFRSMVGTGNITEEMRNGLRDSLVQTFHRLRQNEKTLSKHEFVLDPDEIRSVLGCIAWYNFKLANISTKGLYSHVKHQNESLDSIRHLKVEYVNRIKIDLVIFNDDQTVMLLIKITYDEYEDQVLENFIKYEPIDEPETVKWYKYVVINIEVDNNIQIVSGPNRRVVTTKIGPLHRDYIDIPEPE